ncbi:MAG: hypothetical protein DLM70_05275 [Chloroflexi bacterium]|nr:MAG: hypothetical protein DLM70_05275 [Chloroflexota bacterium]
MVWTGSSVTYFRPRKAEDYIAEITCGLRQVETERTRGTGDGDGRIGNRLACPAIVRAGKLGDLAIDETRIRDLQRVSIRARQR